MATRIVDSSGSGLVAGRALLFRRTATSCAQSRKPPRSCTGDEASTGCVRRATARAGARGRTATRSRSLPRRPVGGTPGCGWSMLAPGAVRDLDTGPDEMLVVPLAGSCVVEVEGRRFDLEGRASVFERVTDFAYLPIDAAVRLSSPRGATLALPSARAERRFEPAYGPAAGVPVEIAGRLRDAAAQQLLRARRPGGASPGRGRGPDAGGNTSSYPPHKHDTAVPGGEAELEEIYYFRFDRPGAFGLHRTYTADRGFDVTVAVGMATCSSCRGDTTVRASPCPTTRCTT